MPPTIRGRVGNLPPESTSFVGRRREVADTKRVLSTSRLVTLTGVGGVGKTRLALRLATQVQRAFRDGAWLVELGQLHNPALLAHTVANALGLREQSSRPPKAMLLDYLASRQLLLVLDSCEHLIDAAAKLADILLRSCPELRILATSREPLNISGETTLPVAPLPTPDPQQPHTPRTLSRYDAVTLFTHRATTILPNFTLTTDNHTAVAEICHRLDGLPLAIELATARLPTLSTEEIRRRLNNRYQLLTDGLRDAPTRQQTLRACIEWSYDLCTTAEQLLWNRMAVFASGFELDAAEGICATHDLAAEDLLDLVASLVDKSILIREEHGTVVRYRLLDTIRDYGREKLQQTGQYTALRRQHRDWYDNLVTRADADWISPLQVQAYWQARLRREHPNLRAALEFCFTEPGEAEAGLRMGTALYPYWARGRLSEGRQWLDRGLAGQTPPATTGRAKALHAATLLAGFQGDVPAASALAEQARDLAEQLGDTESHALATHAATNVAVFSGDLPRAVFAGLQEVIKMHRARGDLPLLLEALTGLEFVSGLLGDTARVEACHEEILAITEPRGETWFHSYALRDRGFFMWRQGDALQATGLLEQSLRLSREMDDTVNTVWCLDALACIAADAHQTQRAATLLGAVDALSGAMGTGPIVIIAGYHEQCERQVRCELGEQAFQTAFQHGKGLSFEDATTYALNEQPPATPAPADTETTLTRREQQVAGLIAQGLTNKEIATRLVIAQRTAEAHVERILAKLGLTTRTQIALWIAQQSNNGPDAVG